MSAQSPNRQRDSSSSSDVDSAPPKYQPRTDEAKPPSSDVSPLRNLPPLPGLSRTAAQQAKQQTQLERQQEQQMQQQQQQQQQQQYAQQQNPQYAHQQPHYAAQPQQQYYQASGPPLQPPQAGIGAEPLRANPRARTRVLPRDEWKSSPFDCFQDMEICAVGLFCCWCQNRQTAAWLDGRAAGFFDYMLGLAWALFDFFTTFFCICLDLYCTCENRLSIKRRFNIGESSQLDCGDFLTVCCCLLCANCQHAREMRLRGEDVVDSAAAQVRVHAAGAGGAGYSPAQGAQAQQQVAYAQPYGTPVVAATYAQPPPGQAPIAPPQSAQPSYANGRPTSQAQPAPGGASMRR